MEMATKKNLHACLGNSQSSHRDRSLTLQVLHVYPCLKTTPHVCLWDHKHTVLSSHPYILQPIIAAVTQQPTQRVTTVSLQSTTDHAKTAFIFAMVFTIFVSFYVN